MATGIEYRNFNLNDSNYITERVKDDNLADKDITSSKIARNYGMAVTDTVYASKPIEISGTIKATASTIENYIRDLKKNLSVDGGDLEIAYEGFTMLYQDCTVQLEIDRPIRGADWAKFYVVFHCNKGFGIKENVSPIVSNEVITTASDTIAITIDGSAPLQPIVINCTVDSLTGGTTNIITFSDGTRTISITRLWTALEVLIVDGTTYSVTVDGDEVEYSGVFPLFDPGNQTLEVENDFSARQFTIDVEHDPRYL